jgi:CRISPR-associated endonuclease/helicase Cas3
LTVNHSHLRATALLRHLLVVDEVHSSDTYMTRILESVLAHHVDAGGHALLLSATLGAEARSRLLQPRTSAVKPTLEEAIATPYPLVSTSGGLIRVGDDTASRRIEIEAASWLEDFDAVVAHALAAAQGGAKVLVVKNTVRDCVSTQEALESACRDETVLFKCEDVVAPHHARFARVDREALDHALEQRFGKQRLDGGCIVIATQTVQQSLDIDADLLLTDLCPVDVLLQRIGRLHRHPRVRPAGSERPRAVVIVPASRDLGSLIDAGGRARHHHGLGSVYEDLRVLEATWRAIEEHSTWRIPEMSRLLIESCVHSQRLASIAAAGGEQWKQHEMQMIGTACGLRRQAELCLVDWSKPYSECGFPTDLAGRISTRLGEGDRLVSFDPPFVGPFGTRVGELALCAWWVKGVDAQESASSDVRTADRATHFRFGGRRFVYNRLGLRPEPRGEKSGEDLASTEVSLDDDGP